MRAVRRLPRQLALGAALVLFLPGIALAHLGLKGSTPANGAQLSVVPRSLRLTFTDAVQASVARLRLVGPSGGETPLSPLRHPGDSTTVLLADVMGPLEAGRYALAWQVIGRDGHPVRGTIVFTVAPGAAGVTRPDATALGEPAASVTAPGQEPAAMEHHAAVPQVNGDDFGAGSPGYVAVRWIQFTALLGVIGALAFRFVVLRILGRSEPDPALIADMRRRAATLGACAGVALLVTVPGRLYVQSLAMHGPGQALSAEFMVAMLTNTVWGWGWLLQAAGAITAVTGLLLARTTRQSGWTLAAVGGLALSLTPALSGHAVASPRFTALAVAADTLHVIGAAGWLGSLLFVVAAGIPAAMRTGHGMSGGAVARLVNAFSPTALVFAGLVIATGVIAAWIHVGFGAALWRSEYGRVLLIKVAMLALLIATGAYNWLRVRPALGDEVGAARIRRSGRIELVVAVLVLLVTAVLVATPPPTDMGRADTATDQPVRGR